MKRLGKLVLMALALTLLAPLAVGTAGCSKGKDQGKMIESSQLPPEAKARMQQGGGGGQRRSGPPMGGYPPGPR